MGIDHLDLERCCIASRERISIIYRFTMFLTFA